jgi:hypothetical protein
MSVTEKDTLRKSVGSSSLSVTCFGSLDRMVVIGGPHRHDVGRTRDPVQQVDVRAGPADDAAGG